MKSEYFLERKKIGRSLLIWRVLAVLLLIALVMVITVKKKKNIHQKPFIARINIHGPIFEDRERDKVLVSLTKNDNVKAVVLNIDSPGGTFVGSESLYLYLRKIAEKKNMVASIGGAAVSGGFMAALAADYIVAYSGSITGSVGVILQSTEVSEALNKLGIQTYSFKSSPIKAMPNMFEKMNPEGQKAINQLIQGLQSSFENIVASRRQDISKEKIKILCDGRSYTGLQAVENKLIDAIGGEEEAIEWLKNKDKSLAELEVQDITLNQNQDYNIFDTFLHDNLFTKEKIKNVLFNIALSFGDKLTTYSFISKALS